MSTRAADNEPGSDQPRMARPDAEPTPDQPRAARPSTEPGPGIPAGWHRQRTAMFDSERPRLVGLAYRLLGSLSDAEDVVQEAWLRWARTDPDTIERPAAWLTTVVSRLGLDRLRARRRERVDYVGPWLPEPLVRPMGDDEPERAAELSDSLTTAFLVMLERLSPEERLVLLLVDVFGEPFGEVATLVGRSPDACRQLAVRARRKLAQLGDGTGVRLGSGGGHGRDGGDDVRDGGGGHARDGGAGDVGATATSRRHAGREQLAIATAYVGAVLSGDIETVKAMLSPDAVLVSDGGPHRHAARRPVVGAERIARFVVNIGQRMPHETAIDPVWVNGSPGVVLSLHGRPQMVTLVDVVDGRVQRLYSILNPDKLAALELDVDLV